MSKGRVTLVCQVLVALAFALAVGTKIADPWHAVKQFAAWSIIPGWTAGFLLPLVVAAESFVAAGLLIGGKKGIFPASGVVLLVVFSTALTVEVLVSKRVSCGCFGGNDLGVANSFWFAMMRNVVCIGLLAPSFLAAFRSRMWRARAGGGKINAYSRTGPPIRSGMTLIEMLVVIAIVVVLIALLIPGLHAVRLRADRIEILSDLRTLVQVSTLYSGDHDGDLPAPVDPVRVGADDQEIWYFEFGNSWRSEWGMTYLDSTDTEDSPMAHTYQDSRTFPYLYSAACYSAPVFWDERTPRDPMMFRPQALASVVYPGQKAMFISLTQSGQFQGTAAVTGSPGGNAEPLEDDPVPFGFVDGHAASIPAQSLVAPDWRGESGQPWGWLPMPMHGLHTIDGIRGRDIK